jgi:hypothetical protein
MPSVIQLILPFFLMMLALPSAAYAEKTDPESVPNELFVCKNTPVEVRQADNAEAFSQGDIVRYNESVGSLKREINAFCRISRKNLVLIGSRAKKVVFSMAAGATEPTVYLEDGALFVEFYGGNYNRKLFIMQISDVLRGKHPKVDD